LTGIASSSRPARGAAAFDPAEWELRVELAACYRLFDYFGWTDLINNHISMRLPGPEHHFLINPYGLHYSDVTASNLLKIDLEGRLIEPSEYTVNGPGFVIHSAIHAAVPEARCIAHTHTTAGIAVASIRRGLDPLSIAGGAISSHVAYHDYEGLSLHDSEKARLVADLGDKHALLLRNHGLLVHGPTIPDAFMLMRLLQRACEVQLATNEIDDGSIVSPEILARFGFKNDVPDSKLESKESPSSRAIFYAMLRQIDRTGTPYDS
jgi:ribulose-5-phosphate 4-epimerase/fuculose-1-phosphate aldolase